MYKLLLALLIACAPLSALAQGVPIKGGASSDLATVNANKSLFTVRGKSSAATYTCTATGLTATAAYSMQLDSEASRGFRVQRICVGIPNAAAAALVTVTVNRRSTASTGGTVATSEGTASPAVSKLDAADSNWGGRCAVTPTLGTIGALVDGWSRQVGELGAGTADSPGAEVYCRTYGDESEKAPNVVAGTANGLSVNVTAPGAGALAAGSISITFIGE